MYLFTWLRDTENFLLWHFHPIPFLRKMFSNTKKYLWNTVIHRWHTKKPKSKRLVKPTAKRKDECSSIAGAERPVKQNPPEWQRSQCAGSQWHPIRHAQADRVPLWGRNTDHTERAGIKKSADRAACTSYGKRHLCQNHSSKARRSLLTAPLMERWVTVAWRWRMYVSRSRSPGRLQQFCCALICARVKWLWFIHRFITRISTFKHLNTIPTLTIIYWVLISIFVCRESSKKIKNKWTLQPTNHHNSTGNTPHRHTSQQSFPQNISDKNKTNYTFIDEWCLIPQNQFQYSCQLRLYWT